MRRILALVIALLAAPALAKGERAGDFDYYVLALSWTPSWCLAQGDARQSQQCAPETGFGFTLHGLWPQFETGWPSWCRSARRDPTRAQTAAMADIMGSGGLAWHQWKKHGRCADLTAADYFAVSRIAYDAVTRPDLLRQLTQAVTLPAKVIEAAFHEANPNHTADSITVTCRDSQIAEVRLCLTRDLTPRTCGADVRRDCSGTATLTPLR